MSSAWFFILKYFGENDQDVDQVFKNCTSEQNKGTNLKSKRPKKLVAGPADAATKLKWDKYKQMLIDNISNDQSPNRFDGKSTIVVTFIRGVTA